MNHVSVQNTLHSRASQVFDERMAMLSSIEQDIAPALALVLRSKLAYELQLFERMQEEDARKPQRSRLESVLRAEYFVRAPLPPFI